MSKKKDIVRMSGDDFVSTRNGSVAYESQTKAPQETVNTSPHRPDDFALPSKGDSPLPFSRGIGRRLLLAILLFSSLITLILTAAQLYLDYRRDVNSISDRLLEIERSYLNSIAGSLWNVDTEQLKIQLSGIVRLPDIQAVEVHETVSEVKKPLLVTVGERLEHNTISWSLPIVYNDRDTARTIGTLYIEATLEGVYNRLWEKTLVILGTQAIKTFLVSFFILYVVHYLITRHLVSLANFASSYSLIGQSPVFRLKRRAYRTPDELDRVVSAFNAMCQNLGIAYKNLNTANIDLEARVEERTRNLQQEISERIAAEQALKFSEKRFRDIAETVTDLFWETDENLSITFISGHFHLIGIDAAENLIGQPLANLITTESRNNKEGDWKQDIEQYRQKHSPFRNLEYHCNRNNGNIIAVSISGIPIFDQDKTFTGYRGSVRDISDRRKAEILIQEAKETLERRVQERTQELSTAKEEAELANRSKTDFLNNMSHELRTPLNAVIGFAQMMQHEIMGPLDNPHYKSYASDINSSGLYLLGIISDILDVSKIESGHMALEIETVHLGTVVEKCISMMQDRADKAEVTLNVTPDVSLYHIKADERRFMQIIINLVSNAIKFTNKTGEITISATREGTGDLLLAIADNGIGIPKNQQEGIFKPFTRVESSMICEHEGVGLGLSIVKALVEQHNGHITLQSQEGEGTTIFILLPASAVVEQ
ncbi:ATP-binding protein [Kiloniella laminariae]|uniref:histidine kinase n=1 Tax=Kiloniella laminariae TaxID=454162 RepID=A0ABT4LME9_9PROT|nr:ATP-binding protein [Kiloniella laminariae]MCZ4282310.1 ATP-binding protein [Kiloniella laminariae]